MPGVMCRWAAVFVFVLGAGAATAGEETIWIEAEHSHGVRGSCFPDMGGTTSGHWALSGPGIAPEWTQGGESEWLSIACGPQDATATAVYEFEVPEAATWNLWVRYRDWRDESELFAVRIEQAGAPAAEFILGERPVVDENDELKLLWKWVFGWDSRTVELAKGPARLTLLAHASQSGHRQVDCFCLTTDTSYRPFHREKPAHPTWKFLDGLRGATKAAASQPAAVREFAVPPAWQAVRFGDRDFFYLWNVGPSWLEDLASQDPKRMLVPYQTEPALVAAFREAFGGRTDVPIFGDDRIAPAFHGAGPNILDNPLVVQWLEANPGRHWANMMNYIEPAAMTAQAKTAWQRLSGRYLGNISGESLGHYVLYDTAALNARLPVASSRGDVLAAFSEIFQSAVAAKQARIFGGPVAEPYQYYIPCQSSEMTAFAHACREWGARCVGYESTAVTPGLAMRLAFTRGSARQYGGAWATYRSSNFGDSATIYSEQSLYPGPKYVYDNSYDVWAGAGMTWYKFDIWHQYMSGSSMFYHEQGFDEFWMPGGGATPRKPIQLSPKGRLVEQFLSLTREHPDRGVPFTPIALLLDRAHGWEPNGFQPASFGLDGSLNPAVLAHGRHARMIKEWFKVAYHPYGPREADLNTGVNQAYIPGVFGNIFDVLVTSPSKTDVVDAYPVVVLNGEVELSAEWGRKLASYLQQGGTIVASQEQLGGPGAAELGLPRVGDAAEDAAIVWLPGGKQVDSQRFTYRPIAGGMPLATAGNAQAIASVFDRGKGRLIYISIPHGLGIDASATPLVAMVLDHVRQDAMPLQVEGEVEWLLNRTAKGWLVTLLNPAGSRKPQHGIAPTDYSQQRNVRIQTAQPIEQASEWFTEAALEVERNGPENWVRLVVPAGGVRVVEIR